MSKDNLPKQIEMLVDNLRRQDTSLMSLTDVASVTEVLIGTMSSFFGSIDTSIYRECRALSDYISEARSEIAALQPGNLEDTHIPRAGLELDAIVKSTEDATNTIMTAAEEIMGGDPSDPEAYVTLVNDEVMKIFEACSFQDITGQRIAKVVGALAHIETRVLDLRDLLGVTDADVATAHKDQELQQTEDEKLLAGPALEGEGIQQDDVDALMDGFGAPGDASEAEDAAPEPASEPAPEPKPIAKEPEHAPEPKPAAKDPKPPAPPPPPKPVDPKKLDAMFEEDFDPMAETEAKAAAKAETDKKQAEKPKAKAKTDDKKDTDPEDKGAEVSQDDIDALFG